MPAQTKSVSMTSKSAMMSKDNIDNDYIMGDEVTYDEYLLDSGASCHVTNDKRSLTNITSDSTKITVGNNAQVVAECSGLIYLQLKHLSSRYVFELHKVYYVPSFGKKIISIPQLTRHGYSLTFREQYCDMQLKNGGMLTISHSRDRMYYIYGKHMTKTKVFSMWRTDALLMLLPETNSEEMLSKIPMEDNILEACTNTIDINNAHNKMGHIGHQQIRRTLRLLGYNMKGEAKACEVCKLAKAS